MLEARGLVDEAGHLPRARMTHGYFRLSGYWRYFQIDPSAGRNAFLHGTEFLEVLDIYRLDAELRNLLLEGISEVEVALRASLIANLCTPGGLGTEYLQETTYSDRVDASGRSHRAKLLSDIRDVCAHHSRIWNRPVQQDQPRLFSGAFPPGVGPRDFVGAPWGVISVLGHMVMQVRNDTTFADAVHRLVTSNSLYWQGVSDPSDA
ncbi:Abi family protein [Plantibacter flavus]|uniref:Abi family protein n=1 Tax=Plantibacter flavus TaxID=150123 RepID=UPI001474D4F6|nr:Abi family protein [Plantibacter flavus]